MKLLPQSRALLEKCVDEAYSTETSTVLRYRNSIQFDDRSEYDLEFKRNLLACSIREGARIVQLVTYKGVTIHIMDETSLMATGSLKSIDGCLTTAFCRMEGVERIAFESGGNTGSALTRYGQNAGMETFFFCPLDNLDLLDSRLFTSPRAHLIGVEDRGRVKEFTALFAQETGIRHVPDKSWRYAAALFRGFFILEHLLTATQFDWISQTISAAFGPIGIYNVLKTFRTEFRSLPQFLGIQQEANCPMFSAWQTKSGRPEATAEKREGRLLTKIMYDNSPQTYNTYEDFYRLLLETRGEMLTVNEVEFESYTRFAPECGPLSELLLSKGIAISQKSGQILEKTGMIALVGTLKAIDAGTVKAGSNVLCCLTSGVTEADRRALPRFTVRSPRDVLEYVATIRGEQ